MSTSVGSIHYDLKLDTSKFDSDIQGVQNRLNTTLGKLAKTAKIASIAAGTALATGMTLAAKASWNQVDAVQQAAAMLGRYYDSAEDVTKVQQELIKYAQSDMGVLFNRKDLFQAAGNLAMYGSSAKDVTKQVEILSRGMASNVLTWDEMNAVVGRVVSSGKLSRMEFEMLAKAGYRIDKQFVNTEMSASKFFKVLDSSIPKDISQDMNNIVPVGVRLQTAFRGIGNAILGVNKLQDGFFGGSLGDRIIKGMQSATKTANQLAPTLRKLVADGLAVFDAVAEQLAPAFQKLGDVIIDSVIPAFQKIIGSQFARYVGTALVGAVRVAITGLAYFLDVFSRFAAAVTSNTPLIVTLVGAIVSYKVGVIAATIATTAHAAILGVLKAATAGATGAQLALNVAMKANPVGLIIGLVGGLVAGFASLTSATNKNKSSTDILKQANYDLATAMNTAKDAKDRLRGASLDLQGAQLAVERATRSHTDAVRQFGPKSLEAREAAYSLKRAQDGLRQANSAAKDATNQNNTAQQNLANKKSAVEFAERIKQAAYRQTGTSIDIQTGKVRTLSTELNGINNKRYNFWVQGNYSRVGSAEPRPGEGQGYGVLKRFLGGSVKANVPYIVGENRDGTLNKTSELFVPRTAGHIVNSTNLQKMIRSNGPNNSSSSTTVNGNIIIGNKQDADYFMERMTRSSQLAAMGLAG